MQQQYQNLAILQGRLHEINNGLNHSLQRHDIEISVRAAECKRKHLVLSKHCLRLATKTQVLRNRGYAMDAAEEEMRKKLLSLERTLCDPALSGRGEEIWARMVGVRERGRMLQREFEKAGRTVGGGEIDEEVLKRARKVGSDERRVGNWAPLTPSFNRSLKIIARRSHTWRRSWRRYRRIGRSMRSRNHWL